MKRVLITMIAVLAVASMDVPAQAGQRQQVRRQQRQVRINQRVGQMTGGFFARLMELERRKNEWLFGGR